MQIELRELKPTKISIPPNAAKPETNNRIEEMLSEKRLLLNEHEIFQHKKLILN